MVAENKSVSAPQNSANSDEWETVGKEASQKLNMDVGDVGIFVFEGVDKVVPEDFPDKAFEQLLFRNGDGDLFSSSSYKLKRAFIDVAVGTTARLTRMPDVDTGQASPMIDYRVEVKK